MRAEALDAHQRRPQHLFLVRVLRARRHDTVPQWRKQRRLPVKLSCAGASYLREPAHVGALVDHSHLHLEDRRRIAARVVYRLLLLRRGAREAELDAAGDAEIIGVHELVGQRHVAHAAPHLAHLLQPRELDDARVDRVDRRGVRVATVVLFVPDTEDGDARVRAQHVVVLGEHWARVQSSPDHFQGLQPGTLLRNELSVLLVLERLERLERQRLAAPLGARASQRALRRGVGLPVATLGVRLVHVGVGDELPLDF